MRKPSSGKQDTNKGAWSKQEDQKLVDYIRANGEGCWRSLPQAAGLLRCGKSCRLRWINYLRPDLKRGNFAEDEEDLIIKLHALLGNRWSLIAGRLPGRTDNEVKNYWNSHIRRKLIKMGIDPNNHRLNHSLPPPPPPPPQNQMVSSNASSGSKNKSLKPFKSQGNNDQLSDSASCLDDETTSSIPDLNLDLTITLPSSTSSSSSFSSSSIIRVEDQRRQQQQKEKQESKVERELEFSHSPTLLLFI